RADEANLVDALRTGGKAVLSLVGVEGDRIVGHIFFSPVRIESDDGIAPAVGLAPMAVVPARQRRGIGSRLVRAGLDECRNAGYNYVVVLEHPTYYPRLGRQHRPCGADPDGLSRGMHSVPSAVGPGRDTMTALVGHGRGGTPHRARPGPGWHAPGVSCAALDHLRRRLRQRTVLAA
ncbi:MAG TPA: N-acetyltransferase, partial [Candidatus Tectomicrobia bacterium]